MKQAKPRKESEAVRRMVRRSYRQMNQLIEFGGALAEILLYLQRSTLIPDTIQDTVKNHIANWDAAVLDIPPEYIG